LQANQLLRERSYPIGVTAAPPKIDPQMAANGPTQVRKRLRERRDAKLLIRIVFVARPKHADAPHAVALLRARSERPRDRRAAEKSDEFASSKAKPHLPLPCLQDTLYRVPLFSVRGLPDDILFVEKGPDRGIGLGHLRVRKSAMLAARDRHELVADSRFVERLMEADVLRVRNSWIRVSLDRNDGRQSGSNIRERGHPLCDLFAIRHAAKPRDREVPHVGPGQ
jgi:hypothetical protein